MARRGRCFPHHVPPTGPEGGTVSRHASTTTRGDFNYALRPACSGWTDLPAIKLYRSTASDAYAMNGRRSIEADLDPWSTPGGYKHVADHYENHFFDRRTIPLWVAYSMLADEMFEKVTAHDTDHDPFAQALADPESDTVTGHFNRCVARVREWVEVIACYEKGIIPLLETRIDEEGLPEVKQELAGIVARGSGEYDVPEVISWDNIRLLHSKMEHCRKLSKVYSGQLASYAKERQERPEDKIGTDIIFAGHSLGGALAQAGIVHFGPDHRRIACPGYRFECYASDAPAVSQAEADKLLAFVSEHETVLRRFNRPWRIVQQMEYGDIVPLSGMKHLGAADRCGRVARRAGQNLPAARLGHRQRDKIRSDPWTEDRRGPGRARLYPDKTYPRRARAV